MENTEHSFLQISIFFLQPLLSLSHCWENSNYKGTGGPLYSGALSRAESPIKSIADFKRYHKRQVIFFLSHFYKSKGKKHNYLLKPVNGLNFPAYYSLFFPKRIVLETQAKYVK